MDNNDKYKSNKDTKNNKKKSKKRGNGGFMNKGRNPITSLLYTILSGFVIVILAYVFYNSVILGKSVSNSSIVNVLSNIFDWGLSLAKAIGDKIVAILNR